MREFMFFIRKPGHVTKNLSSEMHHRFLKGCESYIEKLRSEKRLISAQPIEREGRILFTSENGLKETSFQEGGEMIGGYYHIVARDLEEAIAIARENPEFKFNPDTRIEVRPVKTREESTGFVYPGQ